MGKIVAEIGGRKMFLPWLNRKGLACIYRCRDCE
jgi:hypothetical protein